MPQVQTFDQSPVAHVLGKWKKLKLSPHHQKAWDETRAAMLWSVPSFADIWYGMMVDKDGELAWFTDNIPTCATDDKFLYINPEYYFSKSLDERLFINAHEIEHAMFGHAGQSYMLSKQGHIDYSDGVRLPVDQTLLNYAQDYVINDQLVKGAIGSLPEGGLHYPSLINGDMNTLDAYRLLYEMQKKTGRKPSRTTKDGKDMGEGSGRPFDQMLEPGKGQGKTPNKAMSERSQSEWDTTIHAAMEAARLRGQLPAGLERIFGKKLSPKADWRDLFLLAVSKKVGNDRYTWDRLEPQMAFRRIGMPGRTSFGCGLIVIAVDTSGSINQRTLDVFMAEAIGVLEQAKPKRIILTQCDAEIHEWTEVDAAGDLYGTQIKGGGGTAFEPVFERIDAEGEEPDLMIYLTDLYGSFPNNRPAYPVVWGVVGNDSGQPPFGEKVNVPAQAESNSGE